MTRYLCLLSICFLLIVSCKEKKTEQIEEPLQWVSLFNGENLDGWTMKIVGHEVGDNFANTFRVEDNILSIRYDGYGDNFDNRFGALYFDREMTNYRLKVEYRFVGETAPGAPEWGFRDSGVQFHSQSPTTVELNQAFPVCLEYNLHGGDGIDDRPVGEICANGTFVEIDDKAEKAYCNAATVPMTFHGDQWVTIEIDVQDSKIKHYANGVEILDYENPQYDADHEIGKTFIVDGDTTVKRGYISLQSNSHPIDFRKIEIAEY